jgi:hypothetical protein
MSYDVTVMRMSNDNVRVQIEAESGTSVFDMQPDEARRFAFGVIEAANEIDHANQTAPVEGGAA